MKQRYNVLPTGIYWRSLHQPEILKDTVHRSYITWHMCTGCVFLAGSMFHLTLKEKVPNNLEPRAHPCMCCHQLYLSVSSPPSFSHIVLKNWGHDFTVSCKTKFKINFLQQGASFHYGSSETDTEGFQLSPHDHCKGFVGFFFKEKDNDCTNIASGALVSKLPQSV